MTARPILFSGDMVSAILDGRKTQTRRPVKPQPDKTWEDGRPWWNIGGLGGTPSCPYGRPGDLLWVRETWARHPLARNKYYPPGDGHPWGSPIHRATFGAAIKPVCEGFTPWSPSIHMPRWACRLVLEVVRVRVERVQEITEEGARAEGCAEFLSTAKVPWGHAHIPVDAPILSFQNLWDSIYSAKGRGWDANPWVWAVEFKVAAKTLNEAQAILEAA